LKKRDTPGWQNSRMEQRTTSTHGILRPDAGRARFELVRLAPADDVADLVERHWTVRWSLPPGAAFTQEVLPHPCANLVTEADLVAVHGMPHSRGRKRLEGTGSATGTKFRPGALTAFTGRPAEMFVDASLPLAAVVGDSGVELERRLAATAGDPHGHIAAVEEFLRDRRRPADPRFELLRRVVADMLVADRRLGVADFARRHAVSLRTLQRLFRDYVGATPKWVLKRYRVHEAAERLASGEVEDAAWLAADLGYSDQPHFIRDFTAQVGCSPHAYMTACAAARGDAGAEAPTRQAA
jgi:AraC-like DNA-binding protein